MDLTKISYVMRIIILTLCVHIMLGCSTTNIKPLGQSSFRVIYNSHSNRVIGDTIFLKDLGNVAMTLHELGHMIHYKVRRPHKELLDALNVKYSNIPEIIPSTDNEELQDFITTSTRWEIMYPFKHTPDRTIIVDELMANLFVIFTRRGPELDYIEQNFSLVYKEYSKYYMSLRRK